MSANAWLAIDVATAPMVRARELRFAWERYVEEMDRTGHDDDEDPALIRTPIADSWRRSFAAGVDPTGGRLAPVIVDQDDTPARFEGHPLGRTRR